MIRYSWLLLILFYSCSSTRKPVSSKTVMSISAINFLDEFVLPTGMQFDSTTVGGLSGIDYDAIRNQYYLISDDPSTKGPARFYTASIAISGTRIDTIKILKVTALLNPKDSAYSDIRKDRIHSADVEAMRYDADRNQLIWTSEGQRYIRPDIIELQDPTIVLMDLDGKFKDSFALPQNMHISEEGKGPRHNSVFEGVAFDNEFKNVFVAVEDALYEDGPRASINDTTAWIRIMKFDRESKQQVAQYAYQSDAVPFPPNPPGAFKINGISDIMFLGNNKLLVVERAWSTGRVPSDVRVYLADLDNAEDISSVPSLSSTPTEKAIRKTLLLDMNTLGRFIDNVEGVCLGPRLANGRQSLVFVVDDNFDTRQKSQFLLFEIIP